MTNIESTLNKLIDDNEHFLGEKLNKEKAARLAVLCGLCKEIENADPEIIFDEIPFTERSRNGLVVLKLPAVKFYTDQTVRLDLGKLFANSDDFTITATADGVTLSFGIRDMWDSHAYTNDMEHGDQYVGHLKIVK